MALGTTAEDIFSDVEDTREWFCRNKDRIRKLLSKECGNCGKPAVAIHHVIALASGGKNRLTNMFPVCDDCHDLAHERTLHGLRAQSSQRRKFAGKYPLGYVKGKKQGEPLIDEYLAPAVHLIFSLRKQRWSHLRIAYYLRDTPGMPQPYSGPWTPKRVYAAIKRMDVYLGKTGFPRLIADDECEALPDVDPQRPKFYVPEEVIQTVATLWKSGKNGLEISRMTGVCRQTVYKIISSVSTGTAPE